MNNDPIYQYTPSQVFKHPELEVAQAIRKNKPKLIEQLVKTNPNLDIDKIGTEGMTLLSWAIAHSYPRTVEKLLQLGANPNVMIDDGKNIAHLVALCAGGRVDENLELLLKYNGDANGEVGGTPAVFRTVYARRFDRMKLLLNKGADINAIDNQTGLSLIHFCAKLNLYEQVAFLINEGADFNIKSSVGGSVALQVQKRRGKLNEETEKWRTKVEQMLIDRGVVFPVPRPWEQMKENELEDF